jgi:uroporphyrinogen-III decarboxylase
VDPDKKALSVPTQRSPLAELLRRNAVHLLELGRKRIGIGISQAIGNVLEVRIEFRGIPHGEWSATLPRIGLQLRLPRALSQVRWYGRGPGEHKKLEKRLGTRQKENSIFIQEFPMPTMTSRERVRRAIHHQQPDHVPLDLGTTPVTGIHVSTYARLRKALGLPAKPPQVGEPFQMLARVEPEVADLLGVDTVGLELPSTLFGFPNKGWKPFRMPDGTEVQVSQHFETTKDANGDILIYPAGDRTTKPSGRMPKDGNFFDAIIRQGPVDEDHLDPREFAEQQIRRYTDEELAYLQKNVDDLFRNTDKAVVGCWWQGGIGDVALVPGMWLNEPRGIRDPQRWYEIMAENPDYVRGIFEIQVEVAMENLKLYRQAVGDKIDIAVVSGTDFGTQRGPFTSPAMYRALFKPFHRRINDWIHANTKWKTFFHTCGAITAIMEDLIEAGVDIINPVQCSAVGMDAAGLKAKYGDRLVFWGGGVDTQRTLPFGTAEQVQQEVTERIRILGKGGGLVFNTIHNIQAQVPTENLMALFNAVKATW